MTIPKRKRGFIYTFYSYKGGVGRSMALANIAALLAGWDARVLVVDWDLEAPGIEHFFQNKPSKLIGSTKEKPGILDLVKAYDSGKPLDWQDCTLTAHPFGNDFSLSIITAGKTSSYSIQDIHWKRLFNEKNLGKYLNQLRKEWTRKFDFVLIDSRTGINDICGICTVIFPDTLVLFLAANTQNLNGVFRVMTKARARHKQLPFDRTKLTAVPVLSRDENQTEHNLSEKWRKKIAKKLSPFYKDWTIAEPQDVIKQINIPYVAFWSFGEPLSVAQAPDGIDDPRSIQAAYGRVAKLIYYRLYYHEVPNGMHTAHLKNKDLGEFLNKLSNLSIAIVMLHEIQIPSGSLKEAFISQMRNGARFIFLISESTFEKEKQEKYGLYKELVKLSRKKPIDSSKDKLSAEEQVIFGKINSDWDDAPYLYYRCYDPDDPVFSSETITLRGDVRNVSIAKEYTSVPAKYAFRILKNVLQGISESIRKIIGEVNLEEFADETRVKSLIAILKKKKKK